MERSHPLCGMIDGHAKKPHGVLEELFKATHPLHFPDYRLLVVVFQRVSQQEKDAICKEYFGTRMDKQAIGAVLHLDSGQFFPPPWTPGYGHNYPIFDPAVGHDIEAAFRQARAPH